VPKFPEPPAPDDLQRPEESELRLIAAGSPLWRIYFRAGRHPTAWNGLRRFGPTSARFDHHVEPARVQQRAILYAATQGPTCLAEVFQDSRTIDLNRGEPWLVEFELVRDVLLLDLTSRWVTRAGASAAIDSGPRPRSRRWSRVIYEACPRLDGLVYRSSMDPQGAAVVLWERATSALPEHPTTHRALADPTLFDAIFEAAQSLGYVLM